MPENTESFISLIKAMRDAQREYFRLRTSETLRRAKELEKKVDQKILELRSSGHQLELF